MATSTNSQERLYKGKRIVRDHAFHLYTVYGFRAWGDQIGENAHRFQTLTQAKAFIDRMTANNER